MIQFALIVSLGTLAAGIALAVALRLLPTVRLQLAGLALIAVGLPLAAVILGGLVMFHMHDDVKILAVAAASASTALVAALLVGTNIGRRIRGLEAAADELSSGDLKARAPTDAPSELAHLGQAFNAMAANIEALFDARRQLVAWASHDLRTPVASIQAMLEALEDGLASPEEYLPALRQQTQTLAMLIDDLFELARIDAGALTLELREAQLPQLVSHCVRGLEAEARARQIHLESQLDPALPDVRCAPEHVQRVLLNLVTNALRHTPSDGSVFVRARRRASELEVSVEDTGVGLSLEAQQRMFERFWRGDPSRTRTNGGAGLGLAIARGFVEAQGGRIWAENRPEGGARFAFTLPLAESQPAIA
ncbi:MAG TPA: HAMP domain-containing sensor histidine kinase [Solirubrobacteraceae bacterium]